MMFLEDYTVVGKEKLAKAANKTASYLSQITYTLSEEDQCWINYNKGRTIKLLQQPEATGEGRRFAKIARYALTQDREWVSER